MFNCNENRTMFLHSVFINATYAHTYIPKLCILKTFVIEIYISGGDLDRISNRAI